MAFEGCEFSFDGVSSHAYGLVIYNLGNYSQDDTFSYPSTGSFLTERIPHHNSSFYYGSPEEDVAEFTLVFGASPESYDYREPINRWEAQEIASWLTKNDSYKWLEIEQYDLHPYRYRCLISELEALYIGGEHWGFQCTVTCDSPYGYTYPEETTISLGGGDTNAIFHNKSTSNNDYYPLIEIAMNGGDSVTIENLDLPNSSLQLTDLPGQSYTIKIDNDNQIITSDDLTDFNFYEHFNFQFFRLKRGDNTLKLSGVGQVKFICSYPVNIGG